MRIIQNSGRLKDLLIKGQRPDLAQMEEFLVSADDHERHSAVAYHQQHPQLIADYRTITQSYPRPVVVEPDPPQAPDSVAIQHDTITHHHQYKLHWTVWAALIILLLTLLATRGHAQTTTIRTDQGVVQGVSSGGKITLAVTCESGCAGSGGTSSNFGSIFPTSGTAAGFTDGTNMQPGKVDGSDNLFVNCAVGCSGSSFSDSGAFTAGSTVMTNVGGYYNDGATAITSGDAAVFRITPNRAEHVNIRNNAGTEMGTASNPFQVTGANGTFPVTGTFWQTIQPVSCANCSGNVSVSQVTNPWISMPVPESTSTYSFTLFFNGAITGATTVKSSAGNLFGWYIFNPNATTCYLQFYNAASGGITVGTSVIMALAVPAGAAANVSPGSLAMNNFSSDIGIAASTAVTGSTSTCSTGMVVNLWYF